MKRQITYGLESREAAERICNDLNRLVADGKQHPKGAVNSKKIVRFEARGYRFDASRKTSPDILTVEWGIWPIWQYATDILAAEYGGPFISIEESLQYLEGEMAMQ